MSVSASVGFIALFGVAVLNGVVMVSYFNELRREGLNVGRAVIEGAVLRLRPVLITANVAALGLIPMLFATGPGSEIQKPLTVLLNAVFNAAIHADKVTWRPRDATASQFKKRRSSQPAARRAELRAGWRHCALHRFCRRNRNRRRK